jgi:capsule polysaccharide modification protein KpsS
MTQKRASKQRVRKENKIKVFQKAEKIKAHMEANGNQYIAPIKPFAGEKYFNSIKGEVTLEDAAKLEKIVKDYIEEKKIKAIVN